MLIPEGEDIEHAKEHILNSLPKNSIGPAFKGGYIGHLWRKKDFDIYIQGKYLLDEDKKKFYR